MRKSILFGCAVLLGGHLQPGAATADEASILLEFQPEAKLALGWNALTNRPMSSRETCIENFADPVETKNPTLETVATFRLAHTTSDIMDGFQLSTSAAYRGVFYKGEGSVSYAMSQNISADTVNAAGFVTYESDSLSLYAARSGTAPGGFFHSFETAPTTLADRIGGLRLKQEYLALLTSGDSDDQKQFFEICGDSFVSDIYRGGRLSTLLNMSTTTQELNRKLEGDLKGSGGPASISFSSVAESLDKFNNTSFEARSHQIGGCGTTGVIGLDEMKKLVEDFPGCVRKDPAGVRLRVISYASIVPDGAKLRFGVPGAAAEAARTYVDLLSAWKTMRQLRENPGPLAGKLVWLRSIGKTCLGTKQEEIYDLRQVMKSALDDCDANIRATINAPSLCGAESLLTGLKPSETVTASCPATQQILGNRPSSYDYRVFLPATAVPGKQDNQCHQQPDTYVRDAVYTRWIKPTVDLACSGQDIEDRAECRVAFPDRVKGAIHIAQRRATLPRGGYRRSCQKNGKLLCKVTWTAAGRQVMKCKCDRGGKLGWTKPITLQCPQKAALQNCSRSLRYGKNPC